MQRWTFLCQVRMFPTTSSRTLSAPSAATTVPLKSTLKRQPKRKNPDSNRADAGSDEAQCSAYDLYHNEDIYTCQRVYVLQYIISYSEQQIHAKFSVFSYSFCQNYSSIYTHIHTYIHKHCYTSILTSVSASR